MRLRFSIQAGRKGSQVWPGGGELLIETGPGELYVQIVASGLNNSAGPRAGNQRAPPMRSNNFCQLFFRELILGRAVQFYNWLTQPE